MRVKVKMLEKICNQYNVDKKSMGRLVNKIIMLEKRNLNTNRYTQTEIVDQIANMIKEEVNKCY